MSTRLLASLVLALALFAGSTVVAAEALLKPVPTPDLSRLPAAKAEDLRLTRTTFDVKQKALIGPALAEAYAGIELEVNQKHVGTPGWRKLVAVLAATLATAVERI